MSDDRTPAQIAWANYWHKKRISGTEGLRRVDFMAGFDAAVGLRVQIETSEATQGLIAGAEEWLADPRNVANDYSLVSGLKNALVEALAAVGVQTEPDTTCAVCGSEVRDDIATHPFGQEQHDAHRLSPKEGNKEL